MGMYTQFRGHLCVGSIGTVNATDARARFEALQAAFRLREDVTRHWVCEDSHMIPGSNGSLWIFFGSEHKNYGECMDKWILEIVATFRCEGRIEVQYEEEGPGEDSIRVLYVSGGLISEKREPTHCEGYGFDGAIR